MPDKLDLAYSAIGAVLSDEDDMTAFVKKSTGMNLTDIVPSNVPPKKKIEKVLAFLKDRGNQRWLLTRVLFHARAAEEVRQAIVEAFPETLVRVPEADAQVKSALNYLKELLSVPFPQPVKYRLLPSRRSFASMPQKVVALFAYKSLHECFLKLLFSLNANEALLSNPVEGLTPDLKNIADQIDQVVDEARKDLASLGADAPPESCELVDITQFAASLRASADAPEDAARLIDDIQRSVRKSLSKLNGDIFKAVQDLSFDALTDELPTRLTDIRNRQEYQELVQAIRDVTATVLARALKNKMWQDAENDISLIGKYFLLPDDATGIADDWFSLRARVDWLAQLEPDEKWADEAEKYAIEIDNEIYQEKKLDENVRLHFEAYRSWFRGPFLKVDGTTNGDFRSLYLLHDPFKKILNELGR